MGCNTSKDAMQAAAAEVKQQGSADQETAEVNGPTVELTGNIQNSNNSVTIKTEGIDMNTEIGKQVDAVVTDVVDKAKEVAKTIKREVTEIDLNDPEANRAATKIQAAFRGHQTRKSMKQGDIESKSNLQEEFNPDNKELSDAATKIQASFRGHMVRKSAPRKDEDEELSKELEKLDAKAPEEELDIDLNDPELQVAATKIQASFRGHKVRKEKNPGAE